MAKLLGKDYYSKLIPLTTHAAGLEQELRGSDIPDDVSAIFFKVPAGKAVLRTIKEYAGSNAPALSSGGSTARSPVLLKEQALTNNGVTVKSVPASDASYRFRGSTTVYGLI